jgi:hypothetical protein
MNPITRVYGNLANQSGEMALLINWFDEKDRVDYQRGTPTNYLEQDRFTPEMLRELAVYGHNRITEFIESYQHLVDRVNSVFQDGVPMELREIIKTPKIDLIPQQNPGTKLTLDLFNISIEEIQSYDLHQISHSRSEWERELALLARQAQSISEEHKWLANELDGLKHERIMDANK